MKTHRSQPTRVPHQKNEETSEKELRQQLGRGNSNDTASKVHEDYEHEAGASVRNPEQFLVWGSFLISDQPEFPIDDELDYLREAPKIE